MIARASRWTAAEVEAATGGNLVGPADARIDGVCTDTRDPLANHLFVALRGERFDAHDFVDAAVAGGASSLLVQRDRYDPARHPAIAAVLVQDTLHALGDLARANQRRSSASIVGLSGSNGKTTTKEVLAAMLGTRRVTLKTEGNLNNLIGLPMTLLGLEPKHEVAVVEMGMNQRGEIARYCEIAEPNIGLLTNIAAAHIGMLGSIDEVARAKGELFEAIATAGGIAVINLDDPYVCAQADRHGSLRRRTFGVHDAADVRIASVRQEDDGQTLELFIDGTKVTLRAPFSGRHNAANVAAAIATATALESGLFGPADLQAGLDAARRTSGRFVLKTVGKYTVVDDCYNANRASMEAALETASDIAARRRVRLIAVLGEMRELGDFSQDEHRAVGKAAAKVSAVVASFGVEARPIAASAPNGIHEDEDIGKLFAEVRSQLEEGDLILVKGSRGAQMERFISLLQEGVV